MRLFLIATVAALLATCGVAEARVARFAVTLSGSYTTTGTATESGCYSVDGDDNVTPLPPQSGNASESDSFTSARATTIQVSQVPRQRGVDAGRVSIGRPIDLRVAVDRSSQLGMYGTVLGCKPNDNQGAPARDCGTRAINLSSDLFGLSNKPQLGFHFLRHDVVYRPQDPFADCSLSVAQQWFGLFDHALARVSAAKLFNRHVWRLVLTGSRSGSTSRSDGQVSGTASFSEHYRLTLRRVR